LLALTLATQASLFSTVNLAQTKVNRSLVYDLHDYAHTRSPEKSHDVAIALDHRTDKAAGYSGLMRFFKPVYLSYLEPSLPRDGLKKSSPLFR
jgi:hypothetical protein